MIDFNGDWNYEINLSQLSKLNSQRYFGYETRKSHSEKLENGIISLTINDTKDLNPDPLREQLETIRWISSNQDLIIESLFKQMVETIYPYYQKLWDDEINEQNYPSIQSHKELDKAVGINSISIQTLHKDSFAYYTLYFEFCTDEEHGLAVNMHKNNFISFGAIGDIDNKGIIEDMGLNYDQWLKDWQEQRSQKDLVFHKPIEKYNKLKPWQEQENRYYPYGLFHSNRDDDLIQFIENGNITVDGNSTTFLELSIRRDRDRITEYCLNNNPKKLYKPFIEAMNKNRFDLMDKIINLGYSLNSDIAQMSPLYLEIGNLSKAIKANKETNGIMEKIEYLFKNGINPFLKDKFDRDAFYRIGRINDKEVQSKVLTMVNNISMKYFKDKKISTKLKWKFW